MVTKDKDSNEWFFSQDSYILSETDKSGFILYANDTFCEIAGYELSELLGQPHNIVRHPDMPRIAFKGLWDDIQTKHSRYKSRNYYKY
jgi:aerotaxis receptor